MAAEETTDDTHSGRTLRQPTSEVDGNTNRIKVMANIIPERTGRHRALCMWNTIVSELALYWTVIRSFVFVCCAFLCADGIAVCGSSMMV